MADLKTFVSNAAESTLDGSLASGAVTVVVATTTPFPAVPFYVTIDPGVDAKRELVKATAKTATTLTVERGQDGTSDVAHDPGAVIALVPAAAHFTDLHDRIDARAAALTTHEAAANPHPSYLTEAEADALFLTPAEGNAAYEALISRTGATAGEVPTLQADNTLAFAAAAGGDAVPITLDAAHLVAIVGSPTLSTVGSGAETFFPAWLLDATTYEDVAATVVVPTGWATVNVDLWWTNPNASTGDVVWRLHHRSIGDTESTSVRDGFTDVTAAAPGQYVTEVTRWVTGLAVTAGELLKLEAQRRGGDAGDTLANDAALLAVVITKAS